MHFHAARPPKKTRAYGARGAPPPFENPPLKSTVISLGNPLFLENSEENTYELILFY